MNITIPANTMRAVLLAAGKKDIRAYLNGAYFDPAGHIVGTDGHRMHIAQCPAFEGEGVTIHRDTIEAALKLAGKGGDITVSSDGTAVSLTAGAATIPGTAIDAKYPDWRRVLPKATPETGTPSQIAPDYLLDAQKAAALVTDRKHAEVYVRHDGDNCALVTCACPEGSDFFAVIMPRRATVIESPTFQALRGSCD